MSILGIDMWNEVLLAFACLLQGDPGPNGYPGSTGLAGQTGIKGLQKSSKSKVPLQKSFH